MIRPTGIARWWRQICRAAAALVTGTGVLWCGCASLPELPWKGVARDASAGFYKSARLEYRLDAGRLGQPLDVVRVDGRHVAYEQIASSPLADQSVGTLVIQQPHPAGREGMARVTFAIDSSKETPKARSLNPFKSGESDRPSIGNQEEAHEVWAMDIPTVEADRYFKLLSTQNFYDGQAAENGPAQLTATIDGKEVTKSWQPLDELNGLAQRVRREGQLVAYVRPQAYIGADSTAIASVQAYRDLLAKTGPGAATQPAGGVLAQPVRTAEESSYAVR